MSNDILWYEMSDAQKSAFVAQELLHWRINPDRPGLWMPAVRPDDNFHDAATRPQVTLPSMMTDRNALRIVERYVIHFLYAGRVLRLQTEQGYEDGDYYAWARFLDSHHANIGDHEARGKYAYHEAVIVAALRAAHIEVRTHR